MPVTGVKFTPPVAGKILAATRIVLNEPIDVRGRPRRPSFAANPFQYGKLKTTWTPGSETVTLTPCDAAGNVDTPPPDDVTVHITTDIARDTSMSGTTAEGDAGTNTPAMFDVPVGEVLAYESIGGILVLVSPPILTIPTTAVEGMGLFVFNDGAGHLSLRYDYVRLVP